MTQHGVAMAQYYEEFKHSIKIVNLEITGTLEPQQFHRVTVIPSPLQCYINL